MNLAPFTTQPSACPKCGRDPLSQTVRFCVLLHYGTDDQSKRFRSWDDPAHLDVICQRCGFVRLMATKDSAR